MKNQQKIIDEKHRHFDGFSRNTLKFLKGLKANNNKAWFQKHRDEYNKYVLDPLRNLVTDLGEFMLDIDPRFEITPVVNKTISRIYRDTRFSRDKSPFRSTVWITFKNQNKDWTTLVSGYFFELSVNSYRYGMGFYNAAPAIMAKFREMIDENPREFLKTISFFESLFEQEISKDIGITIQFFECEFNTFKFYCHFIRKTIDSILNCLG